MGSLRLPYQEHYHRLTQRLTIGVYHVEGDFENISLTQQRDFDKTAKFLRISHLHNNLPLDYFRSHHTISNLQLVKIDFQLCLE